MWRVSSLLWKTSPRSSMRETEGSVADPARVIEASLSPQDSFYPRAGKRCFDFVAATVGLLLLLPLLALIGFAVRLSSRGPVFFRQVRVGRFGAPFQLTKFRSMRVGSENGSLLTAAGDPRITRLGAWLRRSKLDELPQLWNVIRGDMSLVGPRPEVPTYVARYNERQRFLLTLRPGITGPEINVDEEALLAGREDKEEFYVNNVLPAKLENDLAYLQKVNFSSDLNILFQTFKKLSIRVHEPYKQTAHPSVTSFRIR
jgi:lipopolysaccharide/colanic/teichoic acid biosynthesis glycosyltransferase